MSRAQIATLTDMRHSRSEARPEAQPVRLSRDIFRPFQHLSQGVARRWTVADGLIVSGLSRLLVSRVTSS